MAYVGPTWITPAGSLGTIKELVPFSFDLDAFTGPYTGTFKVIAGTLPNGIRITDHGNIAGYPCTQVTGVPLEVPVEEYHQFVVRITDSEGSIADRTFSITVTGENPPVPLEAPYVDNNLGTFNDGSYIDVNIQGIDTDPGDVIKYRLIQGQLPPGLTLSINGMITGYVVPEALQEDVYGFDQDLFDTVGFDRGTLFISKTFDFDVQLDDGKIPVVQNYKMTIIRSDYLSADSDIFDVSLESIETDTVNKHLPVLIDRSVELATVNDDNHFYYQFKGVDYDGDTIGYDIVSKPGDPYYEYVTVLLDFEGANYGTVTMDKSLSQRLVLFKGDAWIVTSEKQVGLGSLSNNVAGSVAISHPALLSDFSIEGWFKFTDLSLEPILWDTRGNHASSVDAMVVYVGSDNKIKYSVSDVNEIISTHTVTADTWYHVALTRKFGTTKLWVNGRLEGYLNDDNYVFTEEMWTIGNNWAGLRPAGYVDSFRVTNGVARYTETFSVPGYLPVTSVGPADINTVIPAGLTLNRDTGWLGGYIEPINQGRKVYDFTLRVYKKRFEPSGAIFEVDYAVDLPFSAVDGISQTHIDWLNIDLPGTDFNQRTIIFKQQEGLAAEYTNISQGYTWTTSADDGWRDSTNTLVPGYAEKVISPQTVANKRGAIWKFVRSGSNYNLEFVREIFTGSDILADRSVTVLRSDDLEQNSVERYVHYYFKDNSPAVPTYLSGYASNSYESYWLKRLIVENANVAPITWITDADLGNITSGVPSQIEFNANDSVGSSISYELESGEIPLGLELNSDGLLVGKVSHQHWRLNDGTTLDKNTTSFDRVYTFTVKAYTVFNDPVAREVSTSKTFTLTVQDRRNVPSGNLYLDFLLSFEDRETILSHIFDDRIVPDENVYRSGDWHFGRQSNFRMLVGYGINPVLDVDLINAISRYHHKKVCIFNQLKWAQSLDSKGNVAYEVIYIDPQDEFETNDGKSFTGNIALTGYSTPYTADFGRLTADSSIADASNNRQLKAYPATLPNMVKRLKQTASDFDRTFLPTWMLSKQTDGRALNYVTAIPLVYVKPGTGKRILYKLKQAMMPLMVNAKTDRYFWDDGMSLNWDKANSMFEDNPATTFDREVADESINVFRTVDYALSVPFYIVNGGNKRVLRLTGAIDGSTATMLNGKTCVFAQQEYPEAQDFAADDGWVYTVGYENSGYNTDQYDSSSPVPSDKRTGVWQFRDEGDQVFLDFVEEIEYTSSPYKAVRVLNGVKYGGATIALVGPDVSGVGTLPSYVDVSSTLINNALNTRFDGDHTRFLGSKTDTYLERDQGGKYVVFEKTSLLDYGVVDV